MYIQYTFVDFAILLIRQILGAVPLPVTSPFAIEALSFGLTLVRVGAIQTVFNPFPRRRSEPSPSECGR